jgi:acyl carrier protein
LNEAQIADPLREIILRHARLPIETIDDNTRLAADLGFDSLAFLLTISDLEAAFGMTFPLEHVDDLRDVNFKDLVRIVARQSDRSQTDSMDSAEEAAWSPAPAEAP